MMGALLCRLDDMRTIKENCNKIMGQMNQDCISQLLMQYGATQRHMAPDRGAAKLGKKMEEKKEEVMKKNKIS